MRAGIHTIRQTDTQIRILRTPAGGEVVYPNGFLGTTLAIATILVLVIQFSVFKFVIDREAWSMRYIQHYIDSVVIGVTILVVAIPEGLPLAVTLALAYSVKVSTSLSPLAGREYISFRKNRALVDNFFKLCMVLCMNMTFSKTTAHELRETPSGRYPQNPRWPPLETEKAIFRLISTLQPSVILVFLYFWGEEYVFKVIFRFHLHFQGYFAF